MPWFCADAEPRSNARSYPSPDRRHACFETTLAWLRGRFFGKSTNLGRVCSLLLIAAGLIGLRVFSAAE
jgi:hypothetical protein